MRQGWMVLLPIKKMADARKSHRRYAGTAPWDEKEEKRGHYSRNGQNSF